MSTRRIQRLLFVFADELSAGALGAYGNPLARTPNLDRLAGESVVFERAYVSQPVCTPSRATLLTGRWPHQTGCTANNVPLPDDVPCLPELVGGQRFVTGYIGKWHLGDEVFPQHGFEHWVSIEDIYRPWYRPGRSRTAHSTYYHYLRRLGLEPDRRTPDGFDFFSRRFCAGLPLEHTKAAFVADQAIRFILEHQNEPWILFVNFLEPHMPFTGPLDSLYPPDDIRLPPSFFREDEGGLPARIRALRRNLPQEIDGFRLTDERDWRVLVARYLGLVTLVDMQCGRILDALEDAGGSDDTLVVFTSDHGDLMGAHRLFGKCVMYEEAVHVPLMLRIPGVRPGRVCTEVSHVDLIPTLLDLLGEPAREDLPGRGLPGIGDGGRSEAEPVFIEWNPPGIGLEVLGRADSAGMDVEHDILRTVLLPGGWKYTWSLLDRDQLFFLPEDPWEVQNLVADSAAREIVNDCRRRILEWQGRTRDPARRLFAAAAESSRG